VGDSVIVFLDDDPARAALAFQRMTPPDQSRTFWVQNVEETISMLKEYRERLDIVSLGHDLGGQTYVYSARDDTGMEIVRWLEKQNPVDYTHVRFIVHSWNIPAAIVMTRRLRARGYRVIRAPFGEQ
jgi:hypothetical protein